MNNNELNGWKKKIASKLPVFIIGEIEATKTSVSNFLNDFYNHTLEWKNTFTGEIKKVPRFIRNNLGRFKTRCIFSEESVIDPSIFAFIVRFLLATEISISDKWEDAFRPFMELLNIHYKSESKKSNSNKFLIPDFPNAASAILVNVDKETNYSDFQLLFDILQEFKIVEEDNEEQKQLDIHSSVIEIIQYIINELIGNIQEHITGEKGFHTAEMGTYFDSEYLYITFSDAGLTIPKNIQDNFRRKKEQSNITDENLLRWAFIEYNTTKINSNGGRGLYDITKLIKYLNGELICISRNAIATFNKKVEEYERINNKLNGTLFIIKVPQKTVLLNKPIPIKIKNKKIKGVFDD